MFTIVYIEGLTTYTRPEFSTAHDHIQSRDNPSIRPHRRRAVRQVGHDTEAVYAQSFAENAIDVQKVIAFLNAPVKPKRVYRAKAKTERAP